MKPHRTSRSLAAAAACLALAAPAASARPIDPPLGINQPITLGDLSEEEVLASRGMGAPRPVVVTPPRWTPAQSPGGFDWTAAAIGAGAAALAIIAVTLTTPALAARRRVRTAR